MTTCARLTIFEGPDGSGKTTVAKKFAEATGARYVHLGPYLQVKSGLARLYVEAMLPALLGYQDVVMDRSWLSERPYGSVFRQGQDRLGRLVRRQLERVAMRCATTVVWCLPDLEVCKTNFLRRKGEEYLDSVEALEKVYSCYETTVTSLPTVKYDYTISGDIVRLRDKVCSGLFTPPHQVELLSAGHWDAEVLLVGEGFGSHKNQDPLYQWPFGSFSPNGCSQWLTAQVEQLGLEHEFMWVNADQDLPRLLRHTSRKHIVALGDAAAKALASVHVHDVVPHPQYWKRFRAKEEYPLLPLLRAHGHETYVMEDGDV